MRLSYHQPDEVSFTLMLHACAKVSLSVRGIWKKRAWREMTHTMLGYCREEK